MRRHAVMSLLAALLLTSPLGLAAHEGMDHDKAAKAAKPFSMDELIEKARADHAAAPKESAQQDHSEHKPGDKDEAKADRLRTIKGEFIDLSCHTIHQSEGPEHAECAEKCAAAGMPVALRDEKDGKLYLLITEEHFVNAAGPALGKMGKKVKVRAKILKNKNMDMIVPVKVELLGKPAKKS